MFGEIKMFTMAATKIK